MINFEKSAHLINVNLQKPTSVTCFINHISAFQCAYIKDFVINYIYIFLPLYLDCNLLMLL